MKEIIIIIRPHMAYKTKNALAEKGYFTLNNFTVVGRGKKGVVANVVDNASHEEKETRLPDFNAKVLINIFAMDADVPGITDIVVQVNKTGNPGDGKIFVLPCEAACRIRTGEKNESAIL
ncbi:P-II family nitrogen regulator [Treponema primitia]|uniref:P-II family nitrogen regulator n=1 Tax=Treponema primitia TaxID=88058 RepID=UPI0002554CCB|nr:P-II family nitrogen regulator [Treponema primitia]